MTHQHAGSHPRVGQRHFDAPREGSDPANVHPPCSQAGGPAFPRFTSGPWNVTPHSELPVSWQVETAGSHVFNYVAPLLDAAKGRSFAAETTALDMGYDNGRVYAECEDRASRPVIPLQQTLALSARGASLLER